jgi:hypothetical protein
MVFTNWASGRFSSQATPPTVSATRACERGVKGASLFQSPHRCCFRAARFFLLIFFSLGSFGLFTVKCGMTLHSKVQQHDPPDYRHCLEILDKGKFSPEKRKEYRTAKDISSM